MAPRTSTSTFTQLLSSEGLCRGYFIRPPAISPPLLLSILFVHPFSLRPSSCPFYSFIRPLSTPLPVHFIRPSVLSPPLFLSILFVHPSSLHPSSCPFYSSIRPLSITRPVPLTQARCYSRSVFPVVVSLANHPLHCNRINTTLS